MTINYEWLIIGIGFCLLLMGLIFEPFRKAIGLLLIILGILESVSCVFLIIGIPSIFIGGIFLFSSKKTPSVVIQPSPTITLRPTNPIQKSELQSELQLVTKKNEVMAECPVCKEKQSIPIEYSGRQVKCQICKTEFIVKETT
jgi:hypothetical protein